MSYYVGTDTPYKGDKDHLILAQGLKCHTRGGGTLMHYVRIVDVEVPIRDGKAAVVMFDGNTNGPGAGVGGYRSGRLIEIFFEKP